MTESAKIAVVSFDKFINGGDAEKRAVAKELYNAFSTVGWVYLSDSGISQARVDEIFKLVRCCQSAELTKLIMNSQKHFSSFPCKRRLPGGSRIRN